MAPFDAGFIQDQNLQAQVGKALGETVVKPRSLALETAEFGRFSLIDNAHLCLPTGAASNEELEAAPALRTGSYMEFLLHRLDRNGTLTSIVFIAAYAVLMHAV